MKKSLLFILVMVCFIFGTNAQIIHVTPDLLTIQAGIDSAANGDTVLVAEGIYFENINFKGKAITVASQFIIDGDTSHISKTIIDGSKSTNPDTASVVTMWSGEDTTSVLMGFTLTGGSGILITNVSTINAYYIGGGGVMIYNSGGKILHNIIEENHLADPNNKARGAMGCGILAAVNHNHTAIIRNNIIRNNSSTDGEDWGGGICLFGGRMIVEYNSILSNTLNGTGNVGGSGIFYENESFPGTIEEVIIRNNLIMGNKVYHGTNDGFGSGITAVPFGSFNQFQIYNNVIAENSVEGYGGGVSTFWGKLMLYNNTIVNNKASVQGNSIDIFDSDIFMYNNIIWSTAYNQVSEIGFWKGDNLSLKAYYNILKDSFKTGDPVTECYNQYLDPLFLPGTFKLSQNSPAIGWGRDSFAIGSTWYYAPASDIFGNKRPDPVDPYVDAGAVESEFPRPVSHNADIIYIGLMSHHKLCPDVHKDTLDYILRVPDTTIVTPQLIVKPADWLATVDINDADSIPSEDPEERTSTITVTAPDGYTPKIYTVQFDYMSPDATLSNLSISKGTLVPDFHPDTLVYTVCLPRLETKTPTVTCETTDPNASFYIAYAKDIRSSYRPFRTTTITVTAEDGIHKAVYEIEHLINMNIPSITLASDTVILNSNIEATSTEDGYICLVPVYTSKNTDSVMIHLMDSIGVKAQVAAYLPASDTGTYWLYAIDNCLNISSYVVITIIDTIGDGISIDMSSTVKLYPIPIEQTLYIETSETILSVELFNVVGLKVLDKSNPEGRIDMGQLEQGIYFIRIRTEKGEVYIGKVVKK